jgi:uncharacterized RDD family membrane protein YckC
MTRSYGSGGGPDWQRKPKPGLRESQPQPRLRPGSAEPEFEENDEEPDNESQESSPAAWENRLNRMSRYTSQEETVKPERIEFGKRLVSLMIDVVAAYILAAALAVVPYINAYLTQPLVMTTFMLVHDFLFGGRGFGKNLMGLQVVDVRSGEPCTLMQSVKRNIVILGPLLALQIIMLGLQIFTTLTSSATSNPQVAGVVTWMNKFIPDLVNGIGGAYVLLVLPYEIWRVYHRADGRRFGDQLAGTAVIEAPMDFSTPLPRQ